MNDNVCPCAFCRTARAVAAFTASDAYLLLVAAATLGLLPLVIFGRP